MTDCNNYIITIVIVVIIIVIIIIIIICIICKCAGAAVWAGCATVLWSTWIQHLGVHSLRDHLLHWLLLSLLVCAGLQEAPKAMTRPCWLVRQHSTAVVNADGGALIPEGNGYRTYEVDVDTQQMSMLMLTHRNSEGYKHSTFAWSHLSVWGSTCCEAAKCPLVLWHRQRPLQGSGHSQHAEEVFLIKVSLIQGIHITRLIQSLLEVPHLLHIMAQQPTSILRWYIPEILFVLSLAWCAFFLLFPPNARARCRHCFRMPALPKALCWQRMLQQHFVLSFDTLR